MKILFISPTWTDELGVFANLAKKRNSQPPLGILYLATVAEQRGHTARVIDADVEGYDLRSLISEVIGNNFDLVGISATSPIFHKAVSLAKGLKSKGFRSPILIGGEHINIFKKATFFDCFDYGFFGESDYTFEQFLSMMESGSHNYEAMKGFIYRQNGQIIETMPADRIKDLDTLGFPAMHLLVHARYVITFAKYERRHYLPIMASRGCPFKCAFCSEPLTNPHVRFRSAQNVVDEIEKWAKELGISHFFFIDSNLTLNRELIERICHEIIRRNLNITFEGWTRANLVDENLLKLLKTAGLIRMSYGIESGDPEVLRIIHKEVSHEDMLKAFKITDELGIEPACSVMLGLPGDTKASVERTIRFVKNIPQVLYSNFSIANPYPGTEMHDWALTGKHGVHLLVDDFYEYQRYDNSPISVNDLSQEDLVRLQKTGLIRIHMTPKRIWAVIRMVGLLEIVTIFINFFKQMFLSLLSKKILRRQSKNFPKPAENCHCWNNFMK